MVYLLSAGTSIPRCHVNQEQAAGFAREMFKDSFKDIDRLLASFKNGEIESRQFVMPLEWYKGAKSFEEKNRAYVEMALKHSAEAVTNCLSDRRFLKSEVPFETIEAIFFVSSTGISTPSIEARLMNMLPFSRLTKRIPLWGLGCAGGASGIARAFEYCRAFPKAHVLVVAAELCSLTFQKDDKSKSNLIGTSLFGDGIAAVLMCGKEADTSCSTFSVLPELLGSQSSTLKDSEDVMGWEITNSGFQVVFSRDIPSLIRTHLKKDVEAFLDGQNAGLDDIQVFLAHPGGKKVLDAYIDSLGFSEEHLACSRRILARHGNMSSATIMYVIKDCFETVTPKRGKHGLLGALGPGFSSELLFMKWTEKESE
ncbi:MULTISPECIES: type III polyketide synthase [Bacillus]|uniref:Type III polyketide synthase n=1 Tax=Bacillus glycinifermentans TaxID=1664069 RepID=A0AAJ4D3C1_9BACI|nr:MULTISPECIES: 3-oxoacyl-[acyl-carrier-protein] synthase III C-terminal domain-containing protein [Bacillus]KKB73766.1 chalcone synthase [Bacillus sp. TH008]MDU0073119.1 3-oxoacyl-[acyl-carrier-protein] synthase III C-terminal domain-containing protein [Bacillus sp. IG6]MED8020909.1 3-oxoacyl-[acyl-carrier-protein] synthase III C-terminal domain-containing protein [Bacillus glycinifermentans]QAT65757.1 type III polyketide synthase [Bacillus glycinifermentans]WKB75453.1 3-oxoacyl-[acyl-carrie